jgi:hypothetical protein
MRLHDSEDEDDLEIDGMGYSDESDDNISSRGRRSLGEGSSSVPAGNKSQRSARPKSFANDDYPSDEALESSSNEDGDDDDEGVFAASSASRSYSGMPNSDSSIPTSPMKKKQWRGNGRKKGKAVVRDEETAELYRWLPSDWFKSNEPRKTPYHPQVNYFIF